MHESFHPRFHLQVCRRHEMSVGTRLQVNAPVSFFFFFFINSHNRPPSRQFYAIKQSSRVRTYVRSRAPAGLTAQSAFVFCCYARANIGGSLAVRRQRQRWTQTKSQPIFSFNKPFWILGLVTRSCLWEKRMWWLWSRCRTLHILVGYTILLC